MGQKSQILKFAAIKSIFNMCKQLSIKQQQVYEKLLSSIVCQSVKLVTMWGGVHSTSKDGANSMKLKSKNYNLGKNFLHPLVGPYNFEGKYSERPKTERSVWETEQIFVPFSNVIFVRLGSFFVRFETSLD